MVYHLHTLHRSSCRFFCLLRCFSIVLQPSLYAVYVSQFSFFFFLQSPMVIQVFIYMHCIKWDLFPQYDSDLFLLEARD